MLWETLERVNRLRKESLSNPEFVQAAKEHEQAVEAESLNQPTTLKRKTKKQGPKSLADIYHQSDFGSNPAGSQH
ncbi:hypothetical protein QWZ04_19680 [Vibrio tapetis subsp. quintayensis]|uniref:hypothetical protein n=1 Tax=Vibrio tapetis TaxID=52443 RepID=UPI0025B43F27|nr:hypothetical protein [Vibrio tapetis]MDN3682531.1 hypothetical protein [Vibrio tapetis subsp. quintayensis]